jgi:hypothetical protein
MKNPPPNALTSSEAIKDPVLVSRFTVLYRPETGICFKSVHGLA